MVPAALVILVAALAFFGLWLEDRRKFGALKRDVDRLAKKVRVLEEQEADRIVG